MKRKIITQDQSDVYTVIHSQDYIDRENQKAIDEYDSYAKEGITAKLVWIEDADITMDRYIKSMKSAASYWRDDVDVKPQDRIFTLSTCKGMTGGTTRQVIQGKIEEYTEYR